MTVVRTWLLLCVALCSLTTGSAALAAEDSPPVQQTGTIKGILKNPFAKRYPAVVYVTEIEAKRFEPPKTNPVMDQKNLAFTPHVLPVLVGSTIDFPNSDQVRHNVYTTKDSACQFNLGTYPASVVKRITCDRVGVISLLCNVHAEMSGYIVVCPTPYFATTNERGEFSISGVPAGSYKLTFWSERLAATVIEVRVDLGKEADVEFTGLQVK